MDDATLGPQANHQVLASIDLSFCLAEKKKKRNPEISAKWFTLHDKLK